MPDLSDTSQSAPTRGGPPRLLFVLPLLLFGVLAAVIGYFMLSGHDPRLLPSTLIDKPAPEVTLPPIKGWEDRKPGLTTADLKGQVTVVNFFASWCIPCLAEHPQVMALSKVKGVRVVGINHKDRPEAVKDWLTRHGDPYARIGADAGRAAIDWGVYGMPETFILDKTGRIRFKQVGVIRPETLKRKILPVIRELQK
jgi:cytochrome c biogenesis protein CcmG, thiol:disulfide interchange protein DsbE